MAAARRTAAISSPPTHSAKNGLVSFRHLVLPPHTLMRQSGTTYWNPTMSGHVQVRLPLLASHRQHGREPFLFGRKVRKHDVGLRVLASGLAGWMATFQLRDSRAPQQIAFITTRGKGYLLRRERPAARIFIGGRA